MAVPKPNAGAVDFNDSSTTKWINDYSSPKMSNVDDSQIQSSLIKYIVYSFIYDCIGLLLVTVRIVHPRI